MLTMQHVQTSSPLAQLFGQMAIDAEIADREALRHAAREIEQARDLEDGKAIAMRFGRSRCRRGASKKRGRPKADWHRRTGMYPADVLILWHLLNRLNPSMKAAEFDGLIQDHALAKEAAALGPGETSQLRGTNLKIAIKTLREAPPKEIDAEAKQRIAALPQGEEALKAILLNIAERNALYEDT